MLKTITTLLLLALAGCATTPSGFVFSDVPARRPAVMVVHLEHRIAEAEEVRAVCAWRTRESTGAIVRGHPTTPACSWTEDGKKVVLCTNPKSFNNTVALEACGHEAFHFHEIVDHK